MDEVYVAIGRMDHCRLPTHFMALFCKLEENIKKKKICLLTYTINITDSQQVDAINAIFKDKVIHFWKYALDMGRALLSILSPANFRLSQPSKKTHLRTGKAGAENVEMIIRTKRELFFLIIISSLGSESSVFARWFCSMA